MRYVKIAVLALLGLLLLTLSFANLEQVTLRLVPEELGAYTGVTWTVTLPIFLVILGGVVVGLLIGFIWEWLREHRHRAEAARARAEAERLEARLERTGPSAREPYREGDDVLALLEDGGKTP